MLIKHYKILLTILVFLSGNFLIRSQTTKIIGKVEDAETKEPLPFVNVYFNKTTIGTMTDFKGTFSIETKKAVDSLTASCVGYEPLTLPIIQGKFQEIIFQLQANRITLKEVVVVPTENPAEVILKKIIKNKAINNYENIDAYQYEAYTKIQINANNISEKIIKNPILKPFNFVFENLDTSTINGKSYLPIFLSEAISDYFYIKSLHKEKEIIKAVKVSGVENKSVSQLLGNMYQKINIYDNYIVIFEKNFVSPIANFGLNFYKYYLVDSAYIDNLWCYKIMFKPKRKQELTFTGNFWVNDTSFAIKQIELRMVNDANINFINDMYISQEFTKINNYYITKKDKFIVDFNVIENTKKTIGFFGQKITSYDKFVFNKILDEEFYSTPTDIDINHSSYDKNDDYWEQARHDSLTKNEKFI
ncbi:MAG TPA: DUF5686 family protein, partial [Bacteroidales bacterium]|nr:DUF5686 family protein [Bacteroidales bacterium]